jgi:hypothetical protein
MPTRTITAHGSTWAVAPTGAVTANSRDEFGLFFTRGTGTDREIRVTRYSPETSRSPAQSFNELSDDMLRSLLEQSQPAATSPEANYGVGLGVSQVSRSASGRTPGSAARAH